MMVSVYVTRRSSESVLNAELCERKCFISIAEIPKSVRDNGLDHLLRIVKIFGVNHSTSWKLPYRAS